MPHIHITDIPCPYCGHPLMQLDPRSIVYGCTACQTTWKLVDGKWIPVNGGPVEDE